MKMLTVRIRATGQVLEMVPHAAYPMIDAGIAELKDNSATLFRQETSPAIETTTAVPVSEKAVAAPQRKTLRSVFSRNKRKKR